jgi:hypothetical protein
MFSLPVAPGDELDVLLGGAHADNKERLNTLPTSKMLLKDLLQCLGVWKTGVWWGVWVIDRSLS